LAEGNRGRATFLPLEAFGSPLGTVSASSAPGWLNEPGVIGPARNLAKVDERFSGIFDQLLAETVLVEDYATLRRLRGTGAQGTLVTLSGEIETLEGWLTGGSSDLPERGLLGREREIDELKAELAVLQVNSLSAQSEAQALTQRLEEIVGGLSASEAELHEMQIRLTKAEKSLEQVVRQLSDLDQQLTSQRSERDSLQAQTQQMLREHSQAEQDLLGLENSDRQTQETLSLHQAEIEERRKEYDQRALHAGELRVALASLEEQASNLEAEAQRVQNDYTELERQLEEKQASHEADELRVMELDSQVQQRRMQCVQWQAEKDARDQEVAAFQDQRRARSSEKETHAREFRSRQHTLDETRQQHHALELEKRQLEYNLKALEEYLQTEYHLTLSVEEEPETVGEAEGAGNEGAAPEPVDPAVAQARITEIKEKLAGMGSVNLVAMEEYQELQQRHEFLTKQMSDLKDARESLQRLITKINQESRARFLDTFTQVQEKFREVFRRLFNGGEAELVLIDENNLLETGIEIIARPPGKRLQNITLLSGGEKALTAIALLFAIFLIKPSPFCIFDEMDAPLDDTNTMRFGRILQEFAHKSQFIVISHNKITMEKADVLYGVTMQESGVSRIVSVKFKHQEQAQPVEAQEKIAETVSSN
jgi:chromosome segregation protein